ncbi:MAG: alanine racemase [Candidatus Omnitrophota bacterium]
MNNANFIGYRPTWAEVKLDNLNHNLAQVKKRLSAGTKVMVMVKADAYGHGLIPVAKKLVDYGVDYLGVASIDEGMKLREAGINLPILVLGLILETDIEPLFTYGLAVTVCTESFARVLNKKAESLGKSINVHIKVDTGMGRIGVLYREALETIKKIWALKFINIEGIFTHFALADINEEFTFTQINFFGRLIMKLREDNIHIPLVHAANSAGIINFEESHFNMVRPGLVIYGLSPDKNLNIDLKPLLSLKTKIVYVKKVPQGYGISYGHTYVTDKTTTIVTLPIGYGDGYPRNLSNQASVLIKGRYFKISGRVCMDQIMVDVGNTPVKPGDEAVLIGSQGKSEIIVEDLADLSGTIPYEIVCGLGSRIPRIYI